MILIRKLLNLVVRMSPLETSATAWRIVPVMKFDCSSNLWGHTVAWLVEALCYKLRVTSSSLDEVVEFIFNLPKPSRCTMALGFTQALTEMSTRKYSWDKARPERKAENLTAICDPTV
jgi:hypothetical protein